MDLGYCFPYDILFWQLDLDPFKSADVDTYDLLNSKESVASSNPRYLRSQKQRPEVSSDLEGKIDSFHFLLYTYL